MSADFKGQNILIIAERGPQGLQTLSVHVGFFVVLLKEKWLGEGETAFLPGWQRLHCHSNASVCTAALPALWCLEPEGFPSSESTNQPWKHDQCQRSSSSGICWAPVLAQSHRRSEGSTWLWWLLTCHHWSKWLLGIEGALQPARFQVLGFQTEHHLLRINTNSLSWCGYREKLT